MTVLNQLWRGNVSPISDCAETAQIRDLLRLININYEKMSAMLNQEQIKRLENYSGCLWEYEALSAELAFCAGFRLGVRLCAESWPRGESEE